MSSNHISNYGSCTRCCYRGCGDRRTKTRGLRLFQFPLKNVTTWFKHIGNPTMSGITKEILEKRNLRVCEKHFRPEDILPSGRLMHGALPVPFQGELDYQDEAAKAHEEETSRDLGVFKTPQPRSYGKPSAIESMLTVTLNEQTDPPSSDSLPRVDSDVASQLDFNTMSSAMSRARKSANTTEVETQEIAGPSNIESRPCSSKSNIQFVASEITTLQDLEFGTLEESGMGQFTPTPLEEESSIRSRGGAKETETQASASSSGDETQATPCITVMSDDVTVINSGDVTKPSVNKSVNVSQPPVTKLLTQTKSTKAQEKVSGIQFDVENDKLDINAKKLECAIKRLESVSNKFIAASLADKYDQFGKYISSLLRGLPPRKVNSLKKKLVSQVLEALYEEEREPSTTMKTIGTQVALDGLATVPPYRSSLKEQEKGVSGVSKDAITLANNLPILGGNMPILFPGASTSSSFQLLPVIPMSSASMVSATTVVSTPSLVSPVMSAPPVPLTPCETVTTVAKSADGTLLAVTIPKPQMTESMVETDGPKCALHQQRGQKRKQTTAAYLIKKCTRITPKATVDNSSLDIQTVSQTDGGTQTENELQSQEISRDSGGGGLSSSSDQPMAQTDGNSQSEDNSRVTGGGNGLNTINQAMKSEVQMEQQEFEMDIEEGNELAQMKQDQELFETVLCDEGSTSDIYIKEEAPDPEENPPDPDENPPDPEENPPPSLANHPSTSFECPLCNAKCSYRDELVRHLATSHTGSIELQSGSQTYAEHSTEDWISKKPVKGIETSELASSACIRPLQSCPRNSDSEDKSVGCSSNKKHSSLLKLSTDQCLDNNAVPCSLLLSESSTSFSSAPKVPNPNSSFAFINYDPTIDQSIINYVKNCLSKSKQFSSNELVPVARVIKESNEICDGHYFTGMGKMCDCEEKNTLENISLSTSLNRKDTSDLSASDKCDNGGNDLDYSNYDSDEHSLQDDSAKDILGLTEMHDGDFVPNDESNELENMTTAGVKRKRIRRKDFCFYCKEWVFTFARHVLRHHKHESDVKEIISKVIGSRERKDLLTILRKKGNYLASSSGVKLAVRNSMLADTKLLPCTYCLGFYSRLQLWKHRRKCILGPGTKSVHRKRACRREICSVVKVSPTDMPAEYMSLDMEKREKPKNLRETKDISYVEEESDRDMSDKDVVDKTAAAESSLFSKPSTSGFTGKKFNSKLIETNKKKRLFTKWTTEEKAAVAEFFKYHVEERRPPRKKECELLMRKNKTLFQDKTWLKIKVFVQNLYTKKIKL